MYLFNKLIHVLFILYRRRLKIVVKEAGGRIPMSFDYVMSVELADATATAESVKTQCETETPVAASADASTSGP